MFKELFSSLFKINKTPHLMDFMPQVRGELKKDYPLAKLTRFGVGGPAEIFFEPADSEDLANFLRSVQNIPITVIGNGSNLLIRDGGVPGIVIHLGKAFSDITVSASSLICGASAKNALVAKMAMEAGLSRMEFLIGIPGDIGGSTKMNAGAHGTDMSQIVKSVSMIDNYGTIHKLGKEDLIFNYRDTTIPAGWIFTEITLNGEPKEKGEIAELMNKYRSARQENQPTNVKTAGSTFRNPEGLSAWKLIEKAGCRGLRRGGAVISDKHCNFIVNTGNATAFDIEELGEEVRRRVRETSEIDLKWEIRRIGVKKASQSSFGGR